MNERMANNPADPWSFDPLNPTKTPMNYNPLHKQRVRTDIPDRADIYAVQKDIYDGLTRLSNIVITDDHERQEVERAIAPIRSAYKILVRYLQQHGGTQENPGGLA